MKDLSTSYEIFCVDPFNSLHITSPSPALGFNHHRKKAQERCAHAGVLTLRNPKGATMSCWQILFSGAVSGYLKLVAMRGGIERHSAQAKPDQARAMRSRRGKAGVRHHNCRARFGEGGWWVFCYSPALPPIGCHLHSSRWRMTWQTLAYVAGHRGMLPCRRTISKSARFWLSAIESNKLISKFM
jgi:hypothetical protein